MPIPLSTKISKVPILVKRAYHRAKQAFAPKFTPHQRKWINITIDHVSSRFHMKQKPDIKIAELNLKNLFKTPFHITMSIMAGFHFALAIAGKPLTIPLAMFFAYQAFASHLSSEGVFCSGKGIQWLSHGKQKMLLDPHMSLDLLIFTTAHETTHYLKSIGIIKDDRIANSVAMMWANEQGFPPFLYIDCSERITLNKIDQHGVEQFLTGIEKKGSFYRRTDFAESVGKSYEFGNDVGAIALYLNRQGPDHAWNFLRLVGQGTHPIEAYRKARE